MHRVLDEHHRGRHRTRHRARRRVRRVGLLGAALALLVLVVVLAWSDEPAPTTRDDAALDRFVERLNAAFAASPPDLAAYFDALDTDDPALRARLAHLERFARVSLALGAEMNRRFGADPDARGVERRDREPPMRLAVRSIEGPRARLVATSSDGAAHELQARRRRGVWRLDAAATPAAAALGVPAVDRAGPASTLVALTESMEHTLERLRAGELASRDAVEATVGQELARRFAG